MLGGVAVMGGMAMGQAAAPASPVSLPAQPVEKVPPSEAAPGTYILKHTAKLIDGKVQDLEAYKGKVVIIVNTASKCGYTGQYEHLEKLYKAKKDLGLVILGFPSNDFRGQEPGTNTEIAAFCKDTYGVSFPMFEKISVKGPERHPLYQQLATQPAPIGGDPKWNFTKFVVDRSGHIVARFDAKTRDGLEPELIAKVDELLAGK